MNPDDVLNSMTTREKALEHLKTWTKKKLITQLLNASKDGWLEHWANEFEKDQEK